MEARRHGAAFAPGSERHLSTTRIGDRLDETLRSMK
jgi:hypothetical protein